MQAGNFDCLRGREDHLENQSDNGRDESGDAGTEKGDYCSDECKHGVLLGTSGLTRVQDLLCPENQVTLHKTAAQQLFLQTMTCINYALWQFWSVPCAAVFPATVLRSRYRHASPP